MDVGFDDAGIFFSDNLDGEDSSAALNATRAQAKNRFKQFIRTFCNANFVYTYR